MKARKLERTRNSPTPIAGKAAAPTFLMKRAAATAHVISHTKLLMSRIRSQGGEYSKEELKRRVQDLTHRAVNLRSTDLSLSEVPQITGCPNDDLENLFIWFQTASSPRIQKNTSTPAVLGDLERVVLRVLISERKPVKPQVLAARLKTQPLRIKCPAEKAFRERLHEMCDKGLIASPDGPRRGYVYTPEGKVAIDDLNAPVSGP